MNVDSDPVRSAGKPVRFEATVGGRSRIPRILAVGAVVVAALVLHPWNLLSEGAVPVGPTTAGNRAAAERAAASPPAAAGDATAARAAGAAAVAATDRAGEAICLEPGTWRTATIEQWHSDQTVGVWRAVEPRAASGPTDPAIDVV